MTLRGKKKKKVVVGLARKRSRRFEGFDIPAGVIDTRPIPDLRIVLRLVYDINCARCVGFRNATTI